MLIKSNFEVAQPVDKVWHFFDDIPAVAACLPGTELTDDLGDNKYRGKVAIRMGPVRLNFAGNADIKERDDAAKRLVVDAAGSDEKGRGQAAMAATASLTGVGGGTRVDVSLDLQLSGAAAQYGRGMITDVTEILMRDFAARMQARMTGGAAAAPAAAPVEATEFNVILESFTDKVKTIKVVREITGQGLGEAKATVEGAPKAIKENVDKKTADDVKKKLEESGAKVTVKPAG